MLNKNTIANVSIDCGPYTMDIAVGERSDKKINITCTNNAPDHGGEYEPQVRLAFDENAIAALRDFLNYIHPKSDA